MKRLWYVDTLKVEETFLLRAANVFDGCEMAEPVEVQVSELADVEAILSALKPFARLPRRYMEINGLGSLLRIASLPRTPPDGLVAHALGDLASERHSVLVSSFLTRDEVSWCLSRRGEGSGRGQEVNARR